MHITLDLKETDIKVQIFYQCNKSLKHFPTIISYTPLGTGFFRSLESSILVNKFAIYHRIVNNYNIILGFTP